MSTIHQRFAALVQGPDAEIDLPRAAFAFAGHECPDLDPIPPLSLLEKLGATARERLAGERDPFRAIDGLNELLFEEEGFEGNRENYYDPSNSFLHQVLEQRRGIPITLSVVWLEVAARAGLPARGVGFPGRYLVRYEADGDVGPVFLDPFEAGRILDDGNLQELLARYAGPDAVLDETNLRPATKRETLARMLRNLKGLYASAEAHPSLLWVVESILALEPGNPAEIRDHGMILANLERWPEALGELQSYAARMPKGEDAAEVLKTIRFVRRMAAQLN